jgi:hypothetical protein
MYKSGNKISFNVLSPRFWVGAVTCRYSFKRWVFGKSNKYVCEKYRQILPAIEFWNEQIGNHCMVTFRFIWWHWWFKVGFVVVYNGR